MNKTILSGIVIFVILSFDVLVAQSVKSNNAFNSVFTQSKIIPLSSIQLLHPRAEFKFLDSLMFIADFKAQAIKIYNTNGKFVKALGRKGHGPGEFSQLAFIDVDQIDNSIIALDMNKRISIFSKSGNLHSSFILSEPHYNFDIVAISGEKRLVIGGLKFNSENFEIGSNLGVAHLYSLEGKFIKSFHPALSISKAKQNLLALNFDTIVKTDRNGSIYIAQPLAYELTSYSKNANNAKRLISKSPKYFKIVNEQVPPEAANKRKISNFWYEKPRHLLHSFFVFSDGIVMVAKTFYPKMYSLDIYDKNGNMIKENLQTDMILRGIDKENNLYFTDFEVDKGYILSVYKVKDIYKQDLINKGN